MHQTGFIAAAALGTLLLTFTMLSGAQDHHHDHDLHAADALQLNLDEGRRWATDESLRQGMGGIREAFEERLPAFREESLPAAEFDALAARVDEELAFMFENCDLPPAADAELHKLLAWIAGASAELKDPDRRRSGMVALHRALEAYPIYFDHPGWED